MKKGTIILLILAIALVSCGGGKADKTENVVNAEKQSAMTSDSDAADEHGFSDVGIDNYFDEDDPFSELIVEYTTGQLKQIIGKTEPKDVTDLFLLLPDTDFLLYFNTTVEQRKKMLKGEATEYVKLHDVDVRNGYISSGYEGIWEMFAKKIDGIWWIAVNENNCGEFCSTIQAKTYTYSEGKLVQRNYANLAGYQDIWVELFIDFDQLTSAQKKHANDIWEDNGRDNVLFRLPRDGKTITMYIESYPYIEAGIPESAIKEVTKDLWQ